MSHLQTASTWPAALCQQGQRERESGWEWSSALEHLLGLQKAPASISNTIQTGRVPLVPGQGLGRPVKGQTGRAHQMAS